MKRTFSLVILYLILSGCVSLYEKPEQSADKSVSNSFNVEMKPPSQKMKIPLYDQPITDASSNEPFFNFIENNFGKIVHLNVEINGDDPFIEVNLDNDRYFTIIYSDDKECIETAKAENIPLSISCGGTAYNFTGEGYDFYQNRLSYILSGYFMVPENGGQVHQGIYSIMLEAIPRKEILLKGLE